VLGSEEPVRARPPRPHRPWTGTARPDRLSPVAVALALTAVTGVAVGAALTDLRTQVLAETDASTLSLEARGVEDEEIFELVDDPDGRPSRALVVELRNTGPREVGIESVELVGTGFVAEDVAGRRLREGGRLRLTLLRTVDCAVERDGRPVDRPAPLLVRGLTDAGPREVSVRARLDPYLLADDLERSACGQVPAGQALYVEERRTRFADGVARVEVAVSNGSARPLEVRSLVVPPGLAVRLVDENGQEVGLPLRLPAGDFSVPRRGYPPAGGDPLLLVAEISVAACDALPTRPSQLEGEPLVAVEVTDGEETGETFFGDPFQLLGRLRSTAC
jgi:hypothetical protein